jgi:P pilus assembly chaperone PapD
MKILYALLLLPFMAQAAPEVNIGGLYDYLDGNRSTSLKRVRNGGDSTAFVKVSVAEVVYDAEGKHREIPMDGMPAEQRTLIASPARLIVPAQGMQSVRLLYRGDRDRERYFRLRFIPVLPEVNDGFSVTAQQAEAYQQELKAGLNILAGYGSMLFVRPADTRYQTDVQQAAGRLSVVNRGNATVVLDHVNDCSSDGKQCEPATKHHLLPGSQRHFDKRPGRVYRFELIEGEASRKVEF